MADRPPMAVTSVTIGAPAPRDLAAFYAKLLDWPVTVSEPARPGMPPEDGWAQIRPPAGEDGPTLNFEYEAKFTRPVWPAVDGRQNATQHLDIVLGTWTRRCAGPLPRVQSWPKFNRSKMSESCSTRPGIHSVYSRTTHRARPIIRNFSSGARCGRTGTGSRRARAASQPGPEYGELAALARTGPSPARSASGPPAGFATTTTRGSRRGRRHSHRLDLDAGARGPSSPSPPALPEDLHINSLGCIILQDAGRVQEAGRHQHGHTGRGGRS
jgi:hypothetical protein